MSGTSVGDPAARSTDSHDTDELDRARGLPGGDREAEMVRCLDEGLKSLPLVGADFLGFHLIAELGRGAFSRVYLARQADLAHRAVALKVSPLFGEHLRLAKLQHTNIVPIYSVHAAGRLQAVCMPYFGPTTLADVLKDLRSRGKLPESGRGLANLLRHTTVAGAPEPPETDAGGSAAGAGPTAVTALEGLSYVQAVLWLAVRLADGLAHAHERGILHRDLKPANILLADDGEPMLLDFNLSEDTKRRAHGEVAPPGGTVPYMPPEILDGMIRDTKLPADARSDLYSLGIILYEMLTGRLPSEIPAGPPSDAVRRLLADRLRPPPRLRPWNRAVSPAVESIVQHCLQPDLGRRYQSAAQLREDLQRQLEDRPLRHAPEPSLRERGRKWARRHPRLASPVTLGALLALAVAAWAVPAVWTAWQDSHESAARFAKAQAEALAARQDSRASAAKSEKARADAQRAREAAEQAEAKTRALSTFRKFRKEAAGVARLEDKLTLARIHTGALGLAPEPYGQDLVLCRRALGHYELPDSLQWHTLPNVQLLPPAERRQLEEEVGELLYLLAQAARVELEQAAQRARPYRPVLALAPPEQLAWGAFDALLAERARAALGLNWLAETCQSESTVSHGLLRQRAALAELLGWQAEACDLLACAEILGPDSARDFYRAACDRGAAGRFKDALALADQAAQQAPEHFGTWLLRAICYHSLSRYAEAEGCYNTCLVLRPEFARGYLARGATRLRQKRWEFAEQDCNKALALQPDLAEAYVQRATALQELSGKYKAIRDLTRAIELGLGTTGLYYLRAELRREVGDEDAALDYQRVLREQPSGDHRWLYRALARPDYQAAQAIAELDKALAEDPRCLLALLHKARLLATPLERLPEAARVLDQLLSLSPQYLEARLQRGALRARLGRLALAHYDAEQCLHEDRSPKTHYRAAVVYALASRYDPRDRRRALELLVYALSNGYGQKKFAQDAALASLHAEPKFAALVAAVRLLNPDPPPLMRLPSER